IKLTYQLSQRFSIGRARDTALGYDGGYITVRGDIEGRVLYGSAFGRDWNSVNVRNLGCGALLDGNLVALGERQVQGRDRGGNVKRNAVFFGQDRHRVSADFIGDVSVGSDAIGAHHYATNAAGMEEVPCHVIGDQGCGNVVVLQLPDGQARALQERPRLVGEDIDLLAGSHGRADDSERGSVPGGCERTGITVRQDRLAIGDERRAVPANALIDG